MLIRIGRDLVFRKDDDTHQVVWDMKGNILPNDFLVNKVIKSVTLSKYGNLILEVE